MNFCVNFLRFATASLNINEGNSSWKNFGETLKILGFFNILVNFFLGPRMVRLGFIRMEIDGFCVLGFGNVLEIPKILQSWFLMKISNIFFKFCDLKLWLMSEQKIVKILDDL